MREGKIFKDTYPMLARDLDPDGLPLPRMLLPEKSCKCLAEELAGDEDIQQRYLMV